jgi:hypothetical protein
MDDRLATVASTVGSEILGHLRSRAMVAFSDPLDQAEVISELIALASAAGVDISPSEAQALLTANDVIKRLGGTIAFSEGNSSPQAIAAQARVLVDAAAARGEALSPAQAVRQISQQPTRAIGPGVKPWRRGGPSVVDLPWG